MTPRSSRMAIICSFDMHCRGWRTTRVIHQHMDILSAKTFASTDRVLSPSQSHDSRPPAPNSCTPCTRRTGERRKVEHLTDYELRVFTTNRDPPNVEDVARDMVLGRVGVLIITTSISRSRLQSRSDGFVIKSRGRRESPVSPCQQHWS